MPLNQGVAQAQAMLTLNPSWERVQAVQVLNPRQSVLTLGSERVQVGQALIPRQARVSVPVKAPLGHSGGCHFFPNNAAGITWEQWPRPRRQVPHSLARTPAHST